MARLADIDKLLEKQFFSLDDDGFGMMVVSVTDIISAPTVERKKGRWIPVPSSDMMTGKAYKCSECNKMRYGSFMPNYCQICGAKMDMEVDE